MPIGDSISYMLSSRSANPREKSISQEINWRRYINSLQSGVYQFPNFVHCEIYGFRLMVTQFALAICFNAFMHYGLPVN